MDKLKIGQRVELLPGREELYKKALPGMRGTVQGLNTDADGFEFVYIEWDKDHWRYNGESDGWTYASHFRPAGLDLDHELLGAEEQDIPTVIPILTEAEEDQEAEQYLEVLMTACDRAAESEGFYFVTLKRDEHNHIQLEVLSAALDDEMRSISGADVFQFVEREMRRRDL